MGEAKKKQAINWRPAWTPFERAAGRPPEPWQMQALLREFMATMPREEAEAAVAKEYARLERQVLFKNSRYQVAVQDIEQTKGEPQPPFVWLSIKRIDRQPVGPERFRDFQRIKSELVGPECEGIEIYPAESRLVDTSNQYHLWVCKDSNFRWPFGWAERSILTQSSGGAVQQPFEEDEHDG